MSPRTDQQFEAIRQKSRKAILKAALTLFARNGYSKTTTDDIARKVGISKGLIYNYFSNKEEILEHLIDEFATKVMTIPPPESGLADPCAYLEAVIRSWFSIIRSNPDLVRVGAQFHTDTALQKLIRRKQAEYDKIIIPFFVDVFRRLGSEDPEIDTLLLGSILDGIGLNYTATPGAYPLEKIEHHLVKQYRTLQGRKA